MDSFRNGNIVSLTLNNFQIFKEETFHFQPTLNLIAAPNGSGKSSIANALAFVLGGVVKTIGKSKEISEFIKFGETSSSITAVIFQNGKGIELRRTISKGSKASRYADTQTAASQFFIDGLLVTQANYNSYVRSLGIDVNNLCTFLPQERVAEFCTMDPPDLLVEALKGTSISMDKYKELKKEIDETDAMIMAKWKTKELVENTISGMESGVKKFKEKEELEKLCVKMTYKMLRLKNDLATAEYKAQKKLIWAGEANLAAMESKITECEADIAGIEADKIFRDYNCALEKYERQNEEINGINSMIMRHSSDLEMRKVDGASLIRGRSQKTEQIMRNEKVCNEAERELIQKRKECEELVEEFKEKLRVYFRKNKEEEHGDLLDQVRNISDLMKLVPSLEHIDKCMIETLDRIRQVMFLSGQAQRKIDGLEQQKVNYLEQRGQRMELLKKYHMDTYKAVCWLRENRENPVFEYPVLEPAFLHVNIRKEYSHEVECLLTFQCLSSFLVINQHDFVELSRLLKDEQGLAINIAEIVSDAVNMDELDREVLKRYCVDGVASDFIEADDEYLRMFCAYSFLSSIPVSKGPVDDSELFNSHPRIKRIVADGQYIEIKRSRYSSEWIVASNKIITRGIFNFPKIDLEETENKLLALSKIREQNKNEMSALLAKKEELKNRKESISKEFDLSIIQKYEYAQNSILSRLESNKTGIEILKDEIKEFNKKISKNGEEEKLIIEKLENVCKRLEKLLEVSEIPAFDLEEIRERNLDLENARRTYLIAKTQLEYDTKGVEEARSVLARYRSSVKEMKTRLREEFGNVYFSVNDLVDIPNTIEEIEDELNAANAKIQALERQGGVMKMYENKDNERKKLCDVIENLEERKAEQVKKLDTERTRLIDSILDYLKPMGTYFSAMFKKIGFIGDLKLSTEEPWGLNIMVRFREGEELQKLSSFRQSGGEKSLSTVLFLLALQQTNPAPFRLVDEINQGMDAVNERAVFNIIREMSIESQFFIITPKLVNGLDFSESANSIILYGGPGITNDLENYTFGLLQ